LGRHWLGQHAPLQNGQEVAQLSAFHPHFKTERSPQFEVALQVIFEISAGHA
jgi:hypothetical protein